MSAAILDLQAAIHARLTGDAGLVAALGGAQVHDQAPVNARFPYVTFARAASFDWSASLGDGEEHEVTLHVWSKARGKREALTIAEMVRALLHEAALTLAGHGLVNLRLEATDVGFVDDADAWRARLRLRAVTEPLD